MTAFIAKDHLAHLAGGSGAYDRAAVSGLEGAVAEFRRSSLRGFFSRALHAVAGWPRRRAVMAELSMLSDRELADIGLNRADLKLVFDPAFSASRRVR